MKTVLVTGACGIVGASVCTILSEAGYAVVGVDLGTELPFEAGSVTLRGGADLTDPKAVADLAGALKGEGVELAGLVNIAGGFVWEEAISGSPDTWSRMFQMNVMTTLNACQSFIPLLAKPAAVVNIGAAAADSAGMGMGAYTASKAGVLRLTEALNAELSGDGVRVNAISPTIVDTPTNRKDMPNADFGDWVRPDQIADLAAFLLSDAASAINGENVRIRGGV
ncbi:MAG: SDR family oxidoreductase [Pseudomonadota bacterium]